MRNRGRNVYLLGLLAIIWLSPQHACGADLANPNEFAKAMNRQGMLDKLGRGVSNTLAGWIEMPYAIDAAWNAGDTNVIAGSTVGLVKGAALAIRRTAVGLFEILTFWAPVPEDYGPIIPDPAYFSQ